MICLGNKRQYLYSDKINQYLWGLRISIMIKEENNNSLDWVYYVLGLIFGILTAVIVTGSFGGAILGGIIGFIFGAIFLNGIVKGRQY
jgi:hypothetical protein